MSKDLPKISRIYTRTGDEGLTFFPLFKGKRIPKDHVALEVIGTLDELNSFIGFARSFLQGEDRVRGIVDDLKRVQNKLFHLGSMIIGYGDKARITSEDIEWLEEKIDEIMGNVNIEGFILPGGHPGASALHVARTICRRLERRLVSLARLIPNAVDDVVLKYVNRLSDYLYVLALYVNKELGVSEEQVSF